MGKKKKVKPLTENEAKELGYIPIQWQELKRLCFCDSNKIPKAFIIGDQYSTWQGVGIVQERKATEEEYKTIPFIMEG